MKLAFITTCMGRLAHAKRSSAALLADERVHGNYYFVDFACPQRSGDWIEQTYGDKAKVIRLSFELPEDTEVLFHKTVALNQGAARARDDGADYLVFMDADFITSPAFQNYIYEAANMQQFLILLPPKQLRDLTGFLGVPTKAFFDVGGFDQNMIGWGVEDLDMRIRLFLRAKLICHIAPYRDRCRTLSHSNELRTRHTPFKTTQEAHRYNMRFLDQNVRETTGSSLAQYVKSRPDIRPLLGLSAKETAHELEQHPNKHID